MPAATAFAAAAAPFDATGRFQSAGCFIATSHATTTSRLGDLYATAVASSITTTIAAAATIVAVAPNGFGAIEHRSA